MKKELRLINKELYHLKEDVKIQGSHSNISGEISERLTGEIS